MSYSTKGETPSNKSQAHRVSNGKCDASVCTSSLSMSKISNQKVFDRERAMRKEVFDIKSELNAAKLQSNIDKRKFEQNSKEIEKLKSEAQAAQAKIDQFTIKGKALSRRNSMIKVLCVAMSLGVASMSYIAYAKVNEAKSYQAHISGLTQEISSQGSIITEYNDKNGELNQNLSEKNQALETLTAQFAKAEVSLQLQTLELEQLNIKLSKNLAEKNIIEQKLESADQSLQLKNEQVLSQLNQIQTLDYSLIELGQERAKLVGRIEQAKKNAVLKEKEAGVALSHISKLREEKVLLNIQLAEASDTITVLKEQQEGINRSIKETEAQLKEKNQRISEQDVMVKELELKIQGLEAEIESGTDTSEISPIES